MWGNSFVNEALNATVKEKPENMKVLYKSSLNER